MANRTYREKRLRNWPWVVAIGSIVGVALYSLVTLVQHLGAERHVEAMRQRNEGSTTEHQAETPKTAFEPTDWELGPVALIYVGVLVLLVICSFVLIPAYRAALPDADRTPTISAPGPRLQTNPQGDFQKFRAEEEKRLRSFYWVDREKGTVHIPIDQAMQQLARTGIASFGKTEQ